MSKPNGVFIISLDLELYWGVRDKKQIEEYKDNLLGVREVVPRLLELFNKYNIHATWACVGFLFFETLDELINGLPAIKPKYDRNILSPYAHINNIGVCEKDDPFHYAPSLIKMIANESYQEIATHTFSHYYCLEPGQNDDMFENDLSRAIEVAKKYNLTINSLVFPRNQINESYLSICRKLGIKAYRGNPPSWLYKIKGNPPLIRGLRLLDAYVIVSQPNYYSLDMVDKNIPFNISASRFLRPYSRILKFLEPLKLHRIISELTNAARKGQIYHLWWHPHNFGVNIDQNIELLRKILINFKRLQETYGMASYNMQEMANMISR